MVKSGCYKDHEWAWHRENGAGENSDLERKQSQETLMQQNEDGNQVLSS